MHLFIHTSGRPDKMATWNSLTKQLRLRTTIVVQHKEHHEYTKYPRLMVLPKGLIRLSPTRQYILDNSHRRYICMLDDDILSFGWRQDPKKIKLSVANGRQVNYLFDRCESWMRSGVAHCGISPRGRNHTVADSVVFNARLCQLLCYDLDVVREHNFRMDRVPLMQDFDMTLQMLRAGFENKVLYRGCTNTRGSGGAGGCNAYRTPDMQSSTARKLRRLHPQFVKLRVKDSGQYKGQPTTDVTVQWKKAFASSQEEK